MYILMPREGYDLSTAQDLITENLDFDGDEFLDEKVLTDFYMPKFKIESSYELQGTLTNLGLSLIFDASNADLTGLNVNPEDKSLHVDKVVQKAFIGNVFNSYLYTRWRFYNCIKAEFYLQKNHEKIRETLFTFKLNFILTRFFFCRKFNIPILTF